MTREDREEQRRQVITLRQGGAPVQQIAETVGVHPSTVSAWLKDAGLTRQREKVRTPTVSRRRSKSTHVIGQPRKAYLDPEAVLSLLSGDEAAEQKEDDDRLRQYEEAVRTGQLMKAAAMIPDGKIDLWRQLGVTAAPSFLLSWQSGELLALLAEGVHRSVALSRVGLSSGDFEIWLSYALNHTEPYAEFCGLCCQAQSSAAVMFQRVIGRKMPGWQAVAWQLERLQPEIFSFRSDDRELREGYFDDVPDSDLEKAALAFMENHGQIRLAQDGGVEYLDLDELTEKRD